MLALYAKSKNIVDRQIVADVLKEENISLTSVKNSHSSVQPYRVAVLSLAGIILVLLAAYVVRVLALR
jgi:hypothetical protein